jgi:hypothetical protein
MGENRDGEIRALRRAEAGVRSAAPDRAWDRKPVEPAEASRSAEASPDPSLEPLFDRIGSLESRLDVELASLRDTVEIHGLHLFSKAIEAMSSLEADWIRARAEVDSLKARLHEATLSAGELQGQVERIAEVRRVREAELLRNLEASRRELESSRRQLASATAAQQAAQEQREAAERECRALQQRISWRVMAPLRYVRSLFPKAQG